MKKIAFVAPWFGEKIPGGAEMELRGLVAHLDKEGVELEVLTTCVKDFASDWNVNFHKEGKSEEFGIVVRRFPVRKRRTSDFDAVNYKFMNNISISIEEEDIYFKEMINSPLLYRYIEENKDEYSIFVFIPYMFGTTYFGCQICPEKSIIIPCLHDESYAYMTRLKEIFPKLGGMIFNAEPEEQLAKELYDLSSVLCETIGVGVNTEISYDKQSFVEKYKIDEPFILYAGRKDSGKNVDTLIRYFAKYKERNLESELKLVLIGGGNIEVPMSIKSDIYDLGFVDIVDKYNAYAAASFLCQPSNNESFSLVIMESWLCERPVLVSGKCEVTKYFAKTSKGGLYFENFLEFDSTISYLLNNKKQSDLMGKKGREFVLNNFKWDIIVRKYCEFFEKVAYNAEKKFNAKAEKKEVENKNVSALTKENIGLKRIAIVNQRYGLEVNGGSELHCRQLAEKLKDYYDVEILTTCALDYMTWENYYSEGVEYINGITVRRFPTEEPRDINRFNKLSNKVLGSGFHTLKEEEEWIDSQGPYCPKFLDYMDSHYYNYDAVIFMTYLYYLTARGLVKYNKNSYLLPTAHDEPPIYLKYYEKVFRSPKGIIYNTIEEKKFIENKFGVKEIPSIIAGVGVDIPSSSDIPYASDTFKIDDDYIIYIGRIDESKGCGILFKYFIEYKKRNCSTLKLVLAGKAVMPIPSHHDIINLGFVDDELKFSLIKNSKALVLASEFESLSMVVLESMAMGKPVLVNGKCKVLKGHCLRSNAGLYFNDYFEFEGGINYLCSHLEEYNTMCMNAKLYVGENYRWEKIINKIVNFIGI